MNVVNVTKEQAQYLRALHDAREQAVLTFNNTLTVLTLGHIPAGSKLTGIDTEHGTLLFDSPEASVDER